jgi:hypothetical protein
MEHAYVDLVIDLFLTIGSIGLLFGVLELMARYLTRRDERRRMGRK